MSLFSSSKNNYKILNANKSIIKAEKSYSRAYLDYRQKLLLTAETYFLKGFTCFPTAGKKPLLGFTMEKYNNWNISYEEFKEIFNSDNGTISGIALLGGYNPYFGAYFNCVDIDDLRAFEKLLKSEISDKFFTTRIKTYRGYQHYILSDYEVVGAKILYFEGQKIGEFRGTGVYWVAPPSEFFWPDRENPHKLLFYQYRICEPEYPLIKIGEKGVEEIFEFFQVKGTSPRSRSTTQQEQGTKKERPYWVEFTGEKEKGFIERYFYSVGYRYLCPFHQEKHKSFDFYKTSDGTWRGFDFHDYKGYSLGEIDWWYLKSPKSRSRTKHNGKLEEDFFTMLNKATNAKIAHFEELEGFLNWEPVQSIIGQKRKVNQAGYKKGFNFIFGLMVQESVERFFLPIDLLSEVIGVSYKECWKLIQQLEKNGIVEALYKKRARGSLNKIWVYKKGDKFIDFLGRFQKVTEESI